MAQPRMTLGQKIAPPRFLAFMGIFAVAFLVLLGPLGWGRALMTSFDGAAALFLISIVPLLRATDAPAMRRHAIENDANRVILLSITTVVTMAILTSVGSEMALKSGNGSPTLLIVGTLILAWLFSNIIYALHYAHIYYLDGSEGGLNFSGGGNANTEPGYSDFIYFAFTLGMTFQTSDTGVETAQLRRVVTVHSFAAFVFNIGVLAFTINVLGSRGGG